ncbi:MAG: L,D-transpeptidase [Cyanobacteria bacterium J06600_6]
MSIDSQNKRNFLIIALLISLVPVLYWQLNKIGLIPPANYFFTQSSQEKTIGRSPTPELLNYDRSLEQIISEPIDKSLTKILIDKSDYQLTLYYQDRAVKSYPVVLGKNPQGDKRQEGDFKTPEGMFKVRDLYPHPQWSKFIWLDYPNQESWRKHLAAKQQGEIPLSSTVGSEIGIHGVPKNGDRLIDEQSNWTWGCISLKNRDVDELYSAIKVGTAIEIAP